MDRACGLDSTRPCAIRSATATLSRWARSSSACTIRHRTALPTCFPRASGPACGWFVASWASGRAGRIGSIGRERCCSARGAMDVWSACAGSTSIPMRAASARGGSGISMCWPHSVAVGSAGSWCARSWRRAMHASTIFACARMIRPRPGSTRPSGSGRAPAAATTHTWRGSRQRRRLTKAPKEEPLVLQLRPNGECCDRDLPPDSADHRRGRSSSARLAREEAG